MPDENETRYTTALGNFVEDPNRPGVYISTEIDQSEFIVPANVSQTGQDTPLNISPNTVFITPNNGENASRYEFSMRIDQVRGTPEGSRGSVNPNLDRTAYLNNVSLLASLSNSSGFQYGILSAGGATGSENQAPDTLQPVRIALVASANEEMGPFALVTNSNGGGIINLSDGDPEKLLVELTGVPSIEHLNIPEGYIEALPSFVAGHEVKHLNSERQPGRVLEDWETYTHEIKGDHATLQRYFNSDYALFINDIRALSSINRGQRDDHATHIWSEEFAQGILPTKEQAELIMIAPEQINEILDNNIIDEDIDASIDQNPAERYIYLSSLKSSGTFNDLFSRNPYAEEFLDKYFAAAERRYPQADIEAASERVLMRTAAQEAYFAEPDPDLSEGDVADKLRDDPAYYYANMKVLRENGAFDSIPRANEIIDRRLAQIERENPEAVRSINMNEFRERYATEPDQPTTPTTPVSANIAPPSPPATVSPTM